MTGIFRVYSERTGQGYVSEWGYTHDTHYKLMPKSSKIEYKQKELTITFHSNNIGMRNGEIILEHADSVYRIICLGDSFTEGDGAPYGFSYPRQLEGVLNRNAPEHQSYEVINAGKNGSDIVYVEKLFTTALHEFKPELILVAINDTDLNDIIQRGGTERFKDDNTTAYKKGPWYEPIYIKSHVFRFIIHIPLMKNKLFLGPRALKKERKKALVIIEASMRSLAQFCDEKQIEVRFILHPTASQVSPVRNLALRLHSNDLQTAFEKTSTLSQMDPPLLEPACNLFISLTDTLRELSYKEYAWPVNGHFNAFGYGVMAKKVYACIRETTASMP